MLSAVGGGVSESSGRPVFTSFIKKNWICATTIHHAEPNINISLTRNLPFDSEVRQRSHPEMIPLHCLWAKSNNTMRDKFESYVMCFDFVRSHARYSCFMVCLRFQVVPIKQVDCKMSTKKLNNYLLNSEASAE